MLTSEQARVLLLKLPADVVKDIRAIADSSKFQDACEQVAGEYFGTGDELKHGASVDGCEVIAAYLFHRATGSIES